MPYTTCNNDEYFTISNIDLQHSAVWQYKYNMWKCLELKIIIISDDYDTALHKLKLAEDHSDVQTSDTQESESRPKRRRRIARRLYDDEDDESDYSENVSLLARPPQIKMKQNVSGKYLYNYA